MDTLLWLIVAVLALLIALGAIVPSLLQRRARKRDKKLSYRAKRRIEL